MTVHDHHHEHAPGRAVEHGILYINRDDFPKYLVTLFISRIADPSQDQHNFSLMAMYEEDRKWRYLGQYKIAKIFPMTVSQWENVSEAVKVRKTIKYSVRGSAREWCKNNKVHPEHGFRDAVDQGRWRFDCLLIQCIAFNRQVYLSLREMNTEASNHESPEE